MKSLSNATKLKALLQKSWDMIELKTQKGEYTHGTYLSKKTRHNNLLEFITANNHDDINAVDVGTRFAEELKNFMLYKKGCGAEYTAKTINYLKDVLRQAVTDEEIERSKIEFYKVKFSREFKNNHIEIEQLAKIEKTTFRKPEQVAADLYIFCCYTGLGFAELQKFGPENITIDKDGIEWIFVERKKARIGLNAHYAYQVPLLPEAKRILNKYETLPRRTNQQFNKRLKKVALQCNIHKNLTTHTARKTFGIIMLEQWTFSIESLSYMLGHRSVKTTERYYARVRMQRVKKELIAQIA